MRQGNTGRKRELRTAPALPSPLPPPGTEWPIVRAPEFLPMLIWWHDVTVLSPRQRDGVIGAEAAGASGSVAPQVAREREYNGRKDESIREHKAAEGERRGHGL